MPYPLQHRTKVRQRIIDSARRLFNRRGFDATSVSQIMRGAGLTHGGIAALCIGGMVVARALEDRGHADELRQACVQVALQLGGWQAA